MPTVAVAAAYIVSQPGSIGASAPVSAYSKAVMSHNPLGYYKLNEASGVVAGDYSGNGHAGTINGGPTFHQTPLTDSLDYALLLGAGKNITFGNPAAFQISEGTIECWIKINTTDGGMYGVITKENAFSLFILNHVLQAYDYGGAAWRSSGVTIDDNATHHIAMAFGGGTAQIYVDGNPVGALHAYSVLNQGSEFKAGGVGGDYAGVIDEVAIYPTKLSASSMKMHYTASGYSDAVLADSPLGYWSVDELFGPLAADNSNQDRVGAYFGSPQYGQIGLIQSQLATTAIYESLGYVLMGNPAEFQISTGTIECWIKTGSTIFSPKIFGKNNAYSLHLQFGELCAVDWSTGEIRHSGVNIADGDVHHIALAFGSGTQTIYLDGAAVGGSQAFGVLDQLSELSTGQFNGTIDALAIYGTKLSGAQVLAHYQAGVVSPVFSDAYSTEVINDNPQGYWRLDDINAIAVDASVHGNNGTIRGAPASVDGSVANNKALTFVSPKDVTIPPAASLNVGDLFTIEAWVKLSAAPVGTQYPITGKGAGSPQLLIHDNGHPYLMKEATAGIVQGTVNVCDNQWHHIVGTKNGSLAHIYVDGVDVTFAEAGGTCINTVSDARIGSDAAGRYFSGSIDEVALYNHVLSPTRIKAHYATATDRGWPQDNRADVIVGQRSFAEIINWSPVIPNTLLDPCGCWIDRSKSPAEMYVVDCARNRVLVFPWTNLATWLASDKMPIRVYGQPDFVTCAANEDSGVQEYPITPAADPTMLNLQDHLSLSPFEAGGGTQIAGDGAGGIWLCDFYNNRVLHYPNGSTTADFVIGQDDMTGHLPNKGAGATCSSSSLWFVWGNGNANSYAAGLCSDGAGGVWVGDIGNHRVLHFPSGSATADQVLGQPDFTTHGYTTTPTLSQMISPVALCLTTSGLYVADCSVNRVLRYTPTGANGRAGTAFLPSSIGDGWGEYKYYASAGDDAAISTDNTHLTDTRQAWPVNDLAGGHLVCGGKTAVVVSNTATVITHGGWSGGGNPGNGLKYGVRTYDRPFSIDVDPTEAGALWIHCSSDKNIYLVRESDSVVLRQYGWWNGNQMGDFLGGNVGIDASGNMLFTEARAQNAHEVLCIEKNGADVLAPSPIDGLFPKQTEQDTGLWGVYGVAVANDQLIVGDLGRCLFWNDLSELSNGKAATGRITGFDPAKTNFELDYACCEMIAADADGLHLWVTSGESYGGTPTLYCFALPLHHGDTPILRLQSPINLLGGGTIDVIQRYSWGVAPNHNSTEVWVTNKNQNRAVRIRNPLTAPVVDVILGQSTTGGTGAGSGAAQMNQPGGIALNPYTGDLFVSDNALEDEGNRRQLIFLAATIPSGNGTILLGPNADYIRAAFAGWTPAFTPSGEMVIGMNFYQVSDYRARWFNTPLSTGTTPDGYLDDFVRMPMSVAVDAPTGDVYVGDHNGCFVHVYRAPFAASVTTLVPVSGGGVTIAAMTPTPIAASRVPVTNAAMSLSAYAPSPSAGGVTSPSTVRGKSLKRWPKWWSNR